MEMMMELIHGDKMLLFSTDYPHWDADDPLFAFASMDPQLRRKIMIDNASEFFPRLNLPS
jgi:predicted TIM-barrel fold metal-dependent hydrolase